MAERNANEEERAAERARAREDEGELQAEQESAEAMDADVPHPPGCEDEERRRAGDKWAGAPAPSHRAQGRRRARGGPETIPRRQPYSTRKDEQNERPRRSSFRFSI